jgi:hypothetical protein
MGDLRVGKPDTTPDAPAHIKGVRQGNEPGSLQREDGFYETGEKGAGRPTAKSTSRRSTGINPGARNPIDPNSPTLSPA